ncbi:MAG: TadE/TadG family type IV pilus assembly protein [Solimonas sp.]
MKQNDKRGHRHHQLGAAAVEFAFVFPLLLMMVYAIVVYGYLYVVRESIEFAAHKGIEAVVAVDPSASGVETVRQNQAALAVNCAVYWLAGSCSQAVVASGRLTPQYTACTGGTGAGACPAGYGKVTVTYRVLNNGTWVFPKLFGLPGVGTVPPMPQTMTATAIALLDSP